jgi:hypothetical protein
MSEKGLEDYFYLTYSSTGCSLQNSTGTDLCIEEHLLEVAEISLTPGLRSIAAQQDGSRSLFSCPPKIQALGCSVKIIKREL